MGKSPKVVRRGCKRSFEPMARRKASCTSATWRCTGAKQGCTWCKRLLEDLCAVGPKDRLHPLLTTFGDLPIFDPSPRRSGLQDKFDILRQFSLAMILYLIGEKLLAKRPYHFYKQKRALKKKN